MNLNGKVSNPGEMRTRITLQNRTMAVDAGGFRSPAWADVATVWSKWVNVHGAEVWTAEAVQASQPATVTIRYRAGVEPTWCVLKDGTRYEIVSVDDIQERHEYIELKVRRMADG